MSHAIRLRHDVRFTARCRAFASEGVREHRVKVDSDGTVRVWDSVAGHYTTCHSLSAGAERRLVAEARALLAAHPSL